MLKAKVPASTSNLGPGFDTLGLALQLYLTVTAEPSAQLVIEARGSGASRLSAGEDNLVWRAMQGLAEATGRDVPPQRLHLESEIPLSRGLGSSGAAIAAGLWIANELTGAHRGRQELLRIGAAIEGHPENVAASLFGGLTVNCPSPAGILSTPVTVPAWPNIVLLVSELEVRTEDARRALPESIAYEDAVGSVQRLALLLEAFHSGRYEWLRTAMEDRLHQPYREPLVPGFGRIVAAGYEAGADGVCLSGSGSTVIAFVRDRPDRVARAMQAAAMEAGYEAETRVVGVAAHGVETIG
jgi:homoserine kinase